MIVTFKKIMNWIRFDVIQKKGMCVEFWRKYDVEWHHVAIVRQGFWRYPDIYVDGKRV